MKMLIKNLIWIMLAALSMGCVTTVEYGRWPDPEQLNNLKLAYSTSENVRELLGEPTGKGEGRMPDFVGTATVWSYEYMRTTGSDVKMNMLLVFLWNDKYQGHFWFVAEDKLQVSGTSQ